MYITTPPRPLSTTFLPLFPFSSLYFLRLPKVNKNGDLSGIRRKAGRKVSQNRIATLLPLLAKDGLGQVNCMGR
jgi:hypothetical protein